MYLGNFFHLKMVGVLTVRIVVDNSKSIALGNIKSLGQIFTKTSG